ncbi:unnamed protein product, partial [Ectocarpus sp. 12 AP-2014]
MRWNLEPPKPSRLLPPPFIPSSIPPLPFSSHTHLIRTLCQGERTNHFRGSIKQEDKAILRRSHPADMWCHNG